jgi:hypothetical protein
MRVIATELHWSTEKFLILFYSSNQVKSSFLFSSFFSWVSWGRGPQVWHIPPTLFIFSIKPHLTGLELWLYFRRVPGKVSEWVEDGELPFFLLLWLGHVPWNFSYGRLRSLFILYVDHLLSHWSSGRAKHWKLVLCPIRNESFFHAKSVLEERKERLPRHKITTSALNSWLSVPTRQTSSGKRDSEIRFVTLRVHEREFIQLKPRGPAPNVHDWMNEPIKACEKKEEKLGPFIIRRERLPSLRPAVCSSRLLHDGLTSLPGSARSSTLRPIQSGMMFPFQKSSK